jgi:serine/threonine-protein kinase
LAGHVEAIDVRQPDVEQDEVRRPLQYRGHRAATVVDLSDDVDAFGLERAAGQRTEAIVVIDEEYAQRHRYTIPVDAASRIRAGSDAEPSGGLASLGRDRTLPAKQDCGDGPTMRVILVDDAPLVREGIARLLIEQGVEVVAQLSDATGLLAAVEAERPDVVITDVRMPPTSTTEGLEAAIEVKREHPEVGVLVLSQQVETRHAVDLLTHGRAGVGYLLKERIARAEELVDAARRVAHGGTAIDPEVVRMVLETPRQDDPMSRLTAKERDVLALVAAGFSNERIAEQLDVSARTVETHTGRIFTKLGLDADPGAHRRVLAVLAHLRATSRP